MGDPHGQQIHAARPGTSTGIVVPLIQGMSTDPGGDHAVVWSAKPVELDLATGQIHALLPTSLPRGFSTTGVAW